MRIHRIVECSGVIVLLSSLIRCHDYEYCRELADSGDCVFYKECIEAELQCGNEGYPISYATKYCHQFIHKSDCFTPMVCTLSGIFTYHDNEI